MNSDSDSLYSAILGTSNNQKCSNSIRNDKFPVERRLLSKSHQITYTDWTELPSKIGFTRLSYLSVRIGPWWVGRLCIEMLVVELRFHLRKPHFMLGCTFAKN